jgi:MFS transporter, CP family, cyanate transporter
MKCQRYANRAASGLRPSRLSGRYIFPSVILLVGINLRPTMAAVAPLLDEIQHATGLDDTHAGLLTTFPIALMGLCLLATAQMQARLGGRRGIAIGIVLILASDLLRWHWTGAAPLLIAAGLGGLGIGLVQALMPAVIRHRAGARTARLMGLYSTAIMGGALISGTASPWVAQACGWPAALGIWALPALAASAAWWGAAPVCGEAPLICGRRLVYSKIRAWLLLAFFGLGTGAYTLILAWLPPFYTQLGWSAEAAGALLGAVTFAEVIAGLAVSLWLAHSADRRPALFVAIGALFVGLLCLSLAPVRFASLAVLLTGVGVGALFPLSLIVAMDHGENASDAGAIAGFVQGGGYVLAAVLPFIAGVLRQHLSDLTPVWWLMASLCLVLGLIAARLRPGESIAFPP